MKSEGYHKFDNQAHIRLWKELVLFPLEYALYQIPVSPARRSRASWNPQLEVTFQYRQDYVETVLDGKNPGKGCGCELGGRWFWYERWVAEVHKHCEENEELYKETSQESLAV